MLELLYDITNNNYFINIVALWRISPLLTFPIMPNFLPTGYEAPKSVSFYTKIEDGDKIKLRILPSGLEDRNCITGFEYFEEMDD